MVALLETDPSLRVCVCGCIRVCVLASVGASGLPTGFRQGLDRGSVVRQTPPTGVPTASCRLTDPLRQGLDRGLSADRGARTRPVGLERAPSTPFGGVCPGPHHQPENGSDREFLVCDPQEHQK